MPTGIAVSPVVEETVAELSGSYPAKPETVPVVRRLLSAFARRAGASEQQLDAVRLTVSEAVSNAVLHAYEHAAGEVHVLATVAARELWVLIADDGRGLSSDRSDRHGLGLGLAWMARFSDDLTLVRRSSGGLEVRLRFDLSGASAGGGAQERGSLASAS